MKLTVKIGLMVALGLSLVGCASKKYATSIPSDYTQERWTQQVSVTPHDWVKGADNWFLTGDPNSIEIQNHSAPYSQAMSTLMVKVPDFTQIQVKGDFEVQIFGTYGPNSVYLYGPNEGVRNVAVQVQGNTLCLDQIKNVASMQKTIIRIGVNNLHHLTQMGRGLIEAIRLQSSGLSIATTAEASGSIYLAGHVNLYRVKHAGAGFIYVFGAMHTSPLEIAATHGGSVNISGKNVNIRYILHRGNGNINIIGANSNVLIINASGSGKVGINGRVNIQSIQAKNCVHVYAYAVSSPALSVTIGDDARVGLAGSAHHLSVNTSQSSRFQGRDLCVDDAYVKTQDASHANVAVSNRLFASATDSSSIYYFGTPTILSKFAKSNAMVIPAWFQGGPSCRSLQTSLPVVYTKQRAEKIKGKSTQAPTVVKAYSYPAATHQWQPMRQVKFPKPRGEG